MISEPSQRGTRTRSIALTPGSRMKAMKIPQIKVITSELAKYRQANVIATAIILKLVVATEGAAGDSILVSGISWARVRNSSPSQEKTPEASPKQHFIVDSSRREGQSQMPGRCI